MTTERTSLAWRCGGCGGALIWRPDGHYHCDTCRLATPAIDAPMLLTFIRPEEITTDEHPTPHDDARQR